MTKKIDYSHICNVFHDRHLPEKEVALCGYAAIIAAHELRLPMPHILSAISHKHKDYEKNDWLMFNPRVKPVDTLEGHLTFALKHEGVDLSVLKALFDSIDQQDILNIIQNKPTGIYSRKIWFLYEWLQNTTLPIADTQKGKPIGIIDPQLQFEAASRYIKRYRIFNNLPGTPGFCPTIRKTKLLTDFIDLNLSEKAKQIIGNVHDDILMRAAAFMLLKDSKASFAIEKEIPEQKRAERWGQAIGQAGSNPLSHDEFLRLQQIIISDFRFIHLGYRNEGGFIGEHDRATRSPIPDHISARWQDLYPLMESLIATNELLKDSELDPVLAAAMIAFGFVFIHPFEDGNGRIHRYLIHHVLAEKKFTTDHIIFPISAVILNHLKEYREVLESYSRPRLPFIKWRSTEKGNVEVLNETINLYRYFDVTKQAEFLYQCMKTTIEVTLPQEIAYLKKHDEMKRFIKEYIAMPDRTVNLLILFLQQENGILSKRARQKEFNLLTPQEITTLQEKYKEIFNS